MVSPISSLEAEWNSELQLKPKSPHQLCLCSRLKLKDFQRNSKNCTIRSSKIIHFFENDLYINQYILRVFDIKTQVTFQLISSINIKEMNIVIQQLSTKQSLQDFLLELLNDVEKYFKGASPMTEEKAYATISTIFSRIMRDFPLITSIQSISKRLSNDLRDRISDRCENGRSKKKGTGLKSFMEGIKETNENLAKTYSQESQQNKNTWVKKMLLESITELKEDIKEADILTAQILKSKLNRQFVSESLKPTLVFADSFLTNKKVIDEINGFSIKEIVSDQAGQLKPNSVSIKDAAKAIKNSRLLVISADAVLRNGGILSKNGSLMLAILARQLNIPVLAISRSYCLSEQILLSQESLIHDQTSKSYFSEEKYDNFRVFIAKKYDYIDPRLLSELIGDKKGWQSQSIVEIFQQYYS